MYDKYFFYKTVYKIIFKLHKQENGNILINFIVEICCPKLGKYASLIFLSFSSVQNSGIESLVEELCSKLKEIQNKQKGLISCVIKSIIVSYKNIK